MDLFNETLRVWAQHREFRAVLAELNGCSDRRLGEFGLARADIVRVAYAEAERRLAPRPAEATAAAAEPALPVVGRYRANPA